MRAPFVYCSAATKEVRTRAATELAGHQFYDLRALFRDYELTVN
jgi:hypothetical protein